MSRPPRCVYPGATLHVLNRFVDKHPFFQDDNDYLYFIRTYFEVASNYGLVTYAYCLMPNHFHLCLKTPRGDISGFLCRFLTRVAVTMNHRRGRTGHLFQGRTKTLLVEDEMYFETLVAYILMNPVRAGICTEPFAYPWSSAREMMSGSERLDWRTIAERVSGRRLTGDSSEWKAVIVRWLQATEAARNEARFREGRRGQFLASPEFRKRTLSLLERRGDNSADSSLQTSRTRRRTDQPISKCEWADFEAIASAQVDHAEAIGVILDGWRSRDHAIHEVSVFLAHAVGHWTYEKLRANDRDRFSFNRYAAIVRRMKHQPKKRRLAAQVLERCQAYTFILSRSESIKV
jgi:REP element-mobilizing transposase RayT